MKAWIKKLLALFGPKLSVSTQISVPIEILGKDNYGAWAFCPQNLGSGSVIYSFGVGEDISWDLAMIEKYSSVVHAFDPTPKSIAWIKKQNLPEKFIFHDYGIAEKDGLIRFSPPLKAHHVSYSVVERDGVGEPVDAPVKRLSTIMKELGHIHIDILKMDIEGGEYKVIDDIIKSGLSVSQMLIEFHHRWNSIGIRQTKECIKKLNVAGYKVFYVSPGKDEFSFIRQ